MAKRLETIANVSIVIVAVIASVALVRNLIARRSAPRELPPRVDVGSRFALPDVRNRLVVAVSTTCHYCSESAPFYARLTAKHPAMTVVLPQSVDEGREYARGIGLPVGDVRQAAMRDLKIRGTPTVLLVDGRGIVQRVWEGKLKPDAEAEVLASVP